MSRKTSLLISLFALLIGSVWWAESAGPDFPAQVLDSVKAGLIFRTVLLPHGQLTLQRAEDIGRQFIRDSGERAFSELLIGENKVDLMTSDRGAAPKPESEPSFDEILAQLKVVSGAAGQPVTPIARVVIMQRSAFLSYREAGYGDVTRPGVQELILAGDHDPTRFSQQDGSYRLLQVAVDGASKPNYLYLNMFFKSSSEPSCRACETLAETFQRQTGAHYIDVQIRPDNWFASLWFPLFYRFEPDDQPGAYINFVGRIVPPKVSEYYRRSHVRCIWNGGAVSCEKYGRCETH